MRRTLRTHGLSLEGAGSKVGSEGESMKIFVPFESSPWNFKEAGLHQSVELQFRLPPPPKSIVKPLISSSSKFSCTLPQPAWNPRRLLSHHTLFYHSNLERFCPWCPLNCHLSKEKKNIKCLHFIGISSETNEINFNMGARGRLSSSYFQLL